MPLYNYDYEDMMCLTLGLDNENTVRLTSKVYPTNLEVKMDKEKNIPYLYYEGIVQTNKGAMKIKFPRLDLVLDCITNTESIVDEERYHLAVVKPTVTQYKMTTEFSNISEDSVMFELKRLDSKDYKDIREHFER